MHARVGLVISTRNCVSLSDSPPGCVERHTKETWHHCNLWKVVQEETHVCVSSPASLSDHASMRNFSHIPLWKALRMANSWNVGCFSCDNATHIIACYLAIQSVFRQHVLSLRGRTFNSDTQQCQVISNQVNQCKCLKRNEPLYTESRHI